MLLGFEKQVLKNQEMRIKFPDQPDKFMESEIELNEEIQSLHIISTVPEYYPLLVNARTINTLCSLLSHDNSDIAIAVIDLIQELTDSSTVDDNEEINILVEELLNEKVRREKEGGRMREEGKLEMKCSYSTGDSTAGAESRQTRRESKGRQGRSPQHSRNNREH